MKIDPKDVEICYQVIDSHVRTIQELTIENRKLKSVVEAANNHVFGTEKDAYGCECYICEKCRECIPCTSAHNLLVQALEELEKS